MKLSKKSIEIDFLITEFEDIDFDYFSSEENFLSCFTCRCNTAKEISLNWNAIQSLLSAYYKPQSKIAKWNIYIIFFCSEKLLLQDKYVIQNDKYAARKIIFDDFQYKPTLNEIEHIINNELLGCDLNLVETKKEDLLNLDPEIIKIIQGTPPDMSVRSKELRKEKIEQIIEYASRNEN